MAVKIRLKRMGKKKQPSYRVVVADSRAPRDGRIIEAIGRYDPRQDPSLVEIDNERAQYWLGTGAQPTERARKLLEISGAVEASAKPRGGVYRLEQEATEEPAVEEPVAEEPATEEPTDEPAGAEPVAEEPATEVPTDEPTGESDAEEDATEEDATEEDKA